MTTASLGAHSRPPASRWASARIHLAAWRHKAGVAVKRAAAATVSRRTTVRQLTMTAAGFGVLDAASYQANLGVGLAVTGVSILLFNECLN
jgi:hypothetical protein